MCDAGSPCHHYYLAKVCFHISHCEAVTGCETDIFRYLQRSSQRLFVIFLAGERLLQLIFGKEQLSHQSSYSLSCRGAYCVMCISINQPKLSIHDCNSTPNAQRHLLILGAGHFGPLVRVGGIQSADAGPDCARSLYKDHVEQRAD